MSDGARDELAPCFVVSPIHDDHNEERMFVRAKADYILTELIEPACKVAGFSATRMDQQVEGGWIPEKMIRHLAFDPIAVAVLERVEMSEEGRGAYADAVNANVVYELAVRHAWCMPTVILCPENGVRHLPFDMQDLSTVPYPPLAWDGDRRKVIPWPEEDLASLRTRLKELLQSSLHAKSAVSDRFRPTLNIKLEQFGLSLLHEMKRESLYALKQALARFEGDVLHDYDLKQHSRDAVRALADLMAQPSKMFWSEVQGYRKIAESRLKGVQGLERTRALCRLMEQIAAEVAALVSDLRGAEPGAAPTKNCMLEKVRTIKERIRDAIEDCNGGDI